MSGRFSGKLALITGASQGLGRATSLALAAEGAELILTARNEEGLKSVDDEVRKNFGDERKAVLVPLDLADSKGIDRLGGAIFERWGQLDILIGNGGVLGGLSPIAHIDPSSWEKTIAVNLTANWRLMRAMELLLRQAPFGRAVFVSSSAVRSLRPFWAAYATSKAGLGALTQIWAKECEDSKVKINLFEPGKMRTKMRAEAMPGEDPKDLPTPEAIAPQLLELLLETYKKTGQTIIAK